MYIWPATVAWLRLSHNNSIVFSPPNSHMLGIQTNFGLSGVCDDISFSPPQVCLSTTTLFKKKKKKSVHNRLINQYHSIISTTRVSKITTGKMSSWKTCILFRNFISC